MRTLSLVHNHVSLMFGSRARRLNVFAQNSSHLCVMSLLGVPVSRFPPIASSPTCSRVTTFSLVHTPLVRTRSPPCASAPWGGMSWLSGQSDSRHRLWVQVLRRCQRRAHADQPHRKQQGFLPRLRRDNRHHWESWCTSTLWSGKHIPAHSGSKQSSHRGRNKVHWEIALRKCWRSMILLAVVIASGKPVQTQIEKPLYPRCLGLNQRRRERSRTKSCAIVKRQRKSPQNLWTESCIGRPWRDMGSAKIVWSWGRSGGNNIGERKIQTLLFMRSIRSSNLNDFSYNKQIDGQIGLKEIK